MGRRFARLGGRFVIAVALAIVLVGVAFGVDRFAHRDRVGRNVTLAGFVVADGGVEDIARVLRSEAPGVADMPVTIRTGGLVIETTAGEAGISIDETAVMAAALDARAGSGLIDGFRSWWDSLWNNVSIPMTYQLDPELLRRLVDEHPGRVIVYPVEPAFSGAGDGMQITPPTQGSYLDAVPVIAAMEAAVAGGPPPYTVDVAATPIPTRFDQADLDVALNSADELTTRLTVSINHRLGIVGAESVRRWIESDVIDGKLTAVFNDSKVQSSVAALFSDYAEPLPDPQFTVDAGELHLELGVPARKCCADGVGSLLLAAAANHTVEAIDLPTVLIEDDGGQARADSYGINEMISTFTTRHACCQNRVANIQRIADLVRGKIIKPGETLSINDFVGRRTRENGFVADGTIQGGHFVDQVGGGISQFATTTFNAAFFAGLDIDEYQSHSIYISRYPYGREATLSFPLPDLELTNNTPYAVMLWPSYTSTSITVDMWSTPYFEVEQTGQTSFKIGRCTRVNTYRQRTAPDGTVIDDFVFATYRPGEGLDCNGNPTPDPGG